MDTGGWETVSSGEKHPPLEYGKNFVPGEQITAKVKNIFHFDHTPKWGGDKRRNTGVTLEIHNTTVNPQLRGTVHVLFLSGRKREDFLAFSAGIHDWLFVHYKGRDTTRQNQPHIVDLKLKREPNSVPVPDNAPVQQAAAPNVAPYAQMPAAPAAPAAPAPAPAPQQFAQVNPQQQFAAPATPAPAQQQQFAAPAVPVAPAAPAVQGAPVAPAQQQQNVVNPDGIPVF